MRCAYNAEGCEPCTKKNECEIYEAYYRQQERNIQARGARNNVKRELEKLREAAGALEKRLEEI